MASSENLIEYRAGRMVLQGKTVQPDERKGLLFLRRWADNEIHIHWMDRHSGEIELDVIANAGTLEFRRVEECKTGRVYVLKHVGLVRRYFFWMQEPFPEHDAIFCKRVNSLISSANRRRVESAAAEGDVDTESEPRTDAEELASAGSRGGGGCDIPDDVLLAENPFANAPESELIWPEYFGRESPVDLTPVDVTPFLEVQHQYGEEPHQYGEGEVPMPQLDLAQALRLEWDSAINVLLTSASYRQRLMAHLPADPDDDPTDPEWPNEQCRIIDENLHSPHFYEAMATFVFGFQAGVMGSVVEMVNPNNSELLEAARAGDLETFMRLLHRDEMSD